MIIAQRIEEVRKTVKEWKCGGLTVGLVPTMGALHEGHASLMEVALAECDRVIVSVFVNPTQFSANEDIDEYPKDFEADCRILRERGCHMVFHPDVAEMYPEGFATYVELQSDMTKQLCGKSRPSHFKGVCTVVSKLFNIAAPDRAYFGEKDAQQLAVIRQMARDMAFDIEIVGCPTVREEDGLAKSSRNRYLTKEERKAAQVVYRAVKVAEDFTEKQLGKAAEGGVESDRVLSLMQGEIDREPMAKVDYIEAVDGKTLIPTELLRRGDLVALAVYIGKTRLIDNFTL